MSGYDILIDTNICIYLLNGDGVLGDLLQDETIFISTITEIELYAFSGNDADSLIALNSFIKSVNIINFDETIKENTIIIKRASKLKLPDCMIAATAITNKMLFITSDKAFKFVKDLNLYLYDSMRK
ncbi:MAG: type II toxin-antitoxin system VapC family toxin [Sphingobacteriaceae bacterium]|nr:MAG: type II toxin-antitoxin system VapC family toxin [Sphingobacteriaceae bacterium]